MKTKFCQYAIEEPLTSEQMKWRRNHPDWISDHFYMGMHISSGYRCEELNHLVGGVADSQHLKGEAADIYTFGSCRLLEALQQSRLNFDQAIYYRRRGFIHLSLKLTGKNRRQVIIK